MHKHLTTSFVSRSSVLMLTSLLCLTGCPEPTVASDGGIEEDAGREVLDDAGAVVDSGILDCPMVTPFLFGEPCETEGQVCRAFTCIAPGPGCLSVECRDGVWVNPVSAVDGGPTDDGGALDAGTDDAGVDVDGGDPDAGPLRTFSVRPLFGGLPVDNRVLDPELTLSSYAGWFFYDPLGQNAALVKRVVKLSNPDAAPAFYVDTNENPNGLIVMGAAHAPAGSMRAEINVGRRETASGAGPTVSLLGVFSDGVTGAVDLVPSGTPSVIDGIRWQSHRIVLDVGPIGWAYFLVDADFVNDVFLNAPVVVASTSGAFSAGTSPPPVIRRPLTAVEIHGLKMVRESDRDHLRPPVRARALDPMSTEPRALAPEKGATREIPSR